MSSPSSPSFAHLTDSDLQSLQGERIFRPAVDVALCGPQRKSGYQHAFQHRVRIPLDQRAIHKRTRVPFIGVAYQVFHLAGCIAAELPFSPGRKSGAAPAPQPRRFDLFQRLLRTKLQGLQKPKIAFSGQVVMNIFRIYQSAVAQDVTYLAAHHRMDAEIINSIQSSRRHLPQGPLGTGIVTQDVIFENTDDLVRPDVSVADARRAAFVHDHQRLERARPQAAYLNNLDAQLIALDMASQALQ